MKNTSEYSLSYRMVTVGLAIQLGALGYTICNYKKVQRNPEINLSVNQTGHTGLATSLSGLSINLFQILRNQRPKPLELEQTQ